MAAAERSITKGEVELTTGISASGKLVASHALEGAGYFVSPEGR